MNNYPTSHCMSNTCTMKLRYYKIIRRKLSNCCKRNSFSEEISTTKHLFRSESFFFLNKKKLIQQLQ